MVLSLTCYIPSLSAEVKYLDIVTSVIPYPAYSHHLNGHTASIPNNTT